MGQELTEPGDALDGFIAFPGGGSSGDRGGDIRHAEGQLLEHDGNVLGFGPAAVAVVPGHPVRIAEQFALLDGADRCRERFRVEVGYRQRATVSQYYREGQTV